MVGRLLKLLRNISEVIAGVDDSVEVLSRVVSILARSLDVDVCSVYSFNAQADKLILIATYGLNQDAVGKVKMSSGEGLTGICFRDCSIINVAKPAEQPGYLYFKNTGEEKYESFMALPLVFGGKCVGVLTLQRVVAEKFPPPVVDTTRSLSPQLANLILSAGIIKSLAGDLEPVGYENIEGKEKSFFTNGVAVNSGLASGKVFKYVTRDFFTEVEHGTHNNTENELELFDEVLKLARLNTLELERRALTMISEADASIFNSHLLFLEDRTILDDIKREIVDEKHSLEFSIVLTYKRYEKKFKTLPDHIFRERLADFKDVMLRLLESVNFLRNHHEDLPQAEEQSACDWIVVASELLPSDLMRLPIGNVVGIVCEKGGITSHVAILAKAFSIPALLGAKDIMARVENYDDALLDCYAEKFYVNPDERVKNKFSQLLSAGAVKKEQEIGPAFTRDGKRILLRANVSLISETSLLEKFGADGIGLYRTEFLFMIRDYIPSEETQFDVFSKVVQACKGDVILRLLDAGGDKQISCLNMPQEANPALGIRGIRLLLANPDLLHTHLRAVLRAGQYGKLKILLPMVSNLKELLQIKEVFAEAEKSLQQDNLSYCKNYKLGIMLEVPSVVFGLRQLIKYIDFVCIGTNDLLQFTFALDRTSNESTLSSMCFEPVFLRLLQEAGSVFSGREDKELTICGEMAGNPLALPLLIGAGIGALSMTPKQIPGLKKVITNFSVEECKTILDSAIELKSSEEVLTSLKHTFLKKGLQDDIVA